MAEKLDMTATRREVIAGGVAAGMIAATGGADAQVLRPRLRPDLASPTGKKMLALYAAAVQAMQDPAINYPPQPQSWTFQSYIHAVPANPFDPAFSGGLPSGTPALKTRIDEIYGNPPAGSPAAAWKEAALKCWGTCTHASPYFATWHRWYMYYFERVCRVMCKDPNFLLPYWNYGSGPNATLQLPPGFRNQDYPSLMFDDRGVGFSTPQGDGAQNVAMNAGGYMPFSLINYIPALSTKEMFPSDTNAIPMGPSQPGYAALGMTGRLENAPHDMVHLGVGGWMGNIPSAAGDPIFFVHHCQVDRLYASWEALPGSTYNWGDLPMQPSESTWKDQPAWFVDGSGDLVRVRLGDAIDTAKLGYGYDTLVKPSPVQVAALSPSAAPRPAPAIVEAAMRTKAFAVGAGGATVTFAPEPGAAGVEPRAASPVARDGGSATLVLEGVRLRRRPPAPLSVFVNLPKGTAPQLNDPYYVTTLNFFNFDLATGLPIAHGHGTGHADHAAPARADLRIEVGAILAAQEAKGLWDRGPITVTITTLGADSVGEATYVTFDGATLTP